MILFFPSSKGADQRAPFLVQLLEFRDAIMRKEQDAVALRLRHCGLTDGYMVQQILGQIRNGVLVTSVWIFNGKEVRPLYNTEG